MVHLDSRQDGTRPRRTRDPARKAWYARWRTLRFARRLANLAAGAIPTPA